MQMEGLPQKCPRCGEVLRKAPLEFSPADIYLCDCGVYCRLEEIICDFEGPQTNEASCEYIPLNGIVEG